MPFEYPILLLMIPVLIGLSIWYWRKNYLALYELKNLIHPSKYKILTSMIRIGGTGNLSFRVFWIYVILSTLSLVSLTIALALPYAAGESQIQTKQTSVYFVLDGSWSMDAADMSKSEGYDFVPRFRFEEARFHSMVLNKRLTDTSVGVVTFAGVAVQHTPPIPDKDWIYKVLFEQMGGHNTFYSGSNFTAAFQELLNSSKYLHEGFQVVLYSDGDASEEEKAAALEKLPFFTRLGIPIHVVALGHPDGAEIQLTYDLLDSVDTSQPVSGDAAGKVYKATSNVSVQKRKSIPDFRFLESIAKSTGGVYVATYLDGAGFDTLTSAIESSKSTDQTLLWEAGGKKSLALYFFILPMLFFLYDFLWVRKAVKFES